MMLSILLALTFWWLAAVIASGHLKEVHHGHYGIVVGIAAVVAGWTWLGVVAGLVLLDDAVQHTIQLWKPASSVSVLRWVYGKTLYRIPWVRTVNAWLDRVFG